MRRINRKLFTFVTLLTALAVCSSTVAQTTPYTEHPLADEVFYSFMPIAWRDSDNDAARFGDFDGMTASLDYLEALGITAIWMNPIAPSKAYHGYQHDRADEVNPFFGTEAEWVEFVTAANARGIKVFVDVVVYGISADSEIFLDAFDNPASMYDSFIAFTNAANTSYYPPTSFPTWNGDQVTHAFWDLNDAGARALVTGWMQKWLDPDNDGDFSDGIAGYRADHVWVQYFSGPNGWGYNLDDFWIPFKDDLRSVNPNVITFAEQADWGSYGAEFLPAFDAAFTKPFEFSARAALNSENAAFLYSQTSATVGSLASAETGTYLATIGNHDVDRLASEIGADTPASADKGRAAAAVLMLQPFPPVIYYGDEIGMLGRKGNFGSDANDIPMREPFKWLTVEGSPMSNYWILNAQALAARYSQDNDGRSVEEQDGVAGSLLETWRELIALRKGHDALRRGVYAEIPTSGSSVWSFLRRYASLAGDDESLLVAINLGGAPANATLDLSNFELPPGGSPVSDVQTGATLSPVTAANQAAYALAIPRYGYRVLTTELVELPAPGSQVDGVNIPTSLSPAALTVTQDTPTSLGDNVSELNQMFVRAEGNSLLIGITGNLAQDGTALAVFLDSEPGGQNMLDTSTQTPPPSGIRELNGLIFDAGFAPDSMLYINTFGGTVYVDRLALPTGAPATKVYVGQGSVDTPNGQLLGGVNAGYEVAMNNANTAGVTDVSAAAADTATSGFEIYVPASELGLESVVGSQIGVAALILRSSGSVSSQLLPGVAGAPVDLGQAPDLTGIAGTQHALVDLRDGDGDGITDGVDNCTLVANTAQRDTDADGIGNFCDADLSNDCVVNVVDLGIIKSVFFSTDPHADLNGDGVVNIIDVGLLKTVFFQPPGPSAQPNACD